MAKRYSVARLGEIEPQPCPCGSTRRAFVDDPDAAASMHVVRIKADSQVHYHKTLTEMYYVLDGSGHVEVDGERVPVEPGSAVQIRPLCRHRAVGDLTVLVAVFPPFDPADEWFD